jgi:hypothetical protein
MFTKAALGLSTERNTIRGHGYKYAWNYKPSKLCADCGSIFSSELDNPSMHRGWRSSRSQYTSRPISMTEMLARNCHLCFLQERAIRQAGARPDMSFSIEYSLEVDKSGSGPRSAKLHFTYLHDAGPCHLNSRGNSYSQIFCLTSIEHFGGRLRHSSPSALAGHLVDAARTSSKTARTVGRQNPAKQSRGLLGKSQAAKAQEICPSSTNSAQTWAKAKFWIHECISGQHLIGHHWNCLPRLVHTRALPTRLIKVHSSGPSVHLVDGKQLPTDTLNTTVSYCWV